MVDVVGLLMKQITLVFMLSMVIILVVMLYQMVSQMCLVKPILGLRLVLILVDLQAIIPNNLIRKLTEHYSMVMRLYVKRQMRRLRALKT